MNVYTLHFLQDCDAAERGKSIKKHAAAVVALSKNSFLVSSHSGPKQLAKDLGEKVFVVTQSSSGWYCSEKLPGEINEQISNILNSGNPPPALI